MKGYFVNVLTQILLIHECKDFLERDRNTDVMTGFDHGEAMLC